MFDSIKYTFLSLMLWAFAFVENLTVWLEVFVLMIALITGGVGLIKMWKEYRGNKKSP